ncbi:phosphoesterase RecJ-like protein [Balneicella halophila]|uniref:Phosphoesterase RecJ-like protein n=1 Tax=Balneicella halophila TaxID=1537566 RepID=A0A7L4UNN3_BALHA|nr:bifunctional oligoribonuclease/PAP phosphatase NrnA [Balneicella halophila]PVX49897.1 phosphoesterase RecJ-like protein [Balneicella halophila]
MIKRLKKLIEESTRLAVVMHQNPDGDAMGSALALYEYANDSGTSATVISPTPINENLLWMPHSEHIFIFDETLQSHQKQLQEFDTVVFVDHSSDGRNGSVSDYLTAPTEKRVFIDHHPSPNLEVAIAISEVESAATCCVLYEIFVALNAHISKTMGTCLYTGIITDTGNFRYGKGMAQLFRITSELIILGIDKEQVTQQIYYSNTENRLRLLGFVLNEKMKRVGNHAAYITLTEQEISSLNAKYNDTEDFVNYPLTIKDVYISAIFIEKDDYIKISLRSRVEFDVNLLARNHFNGGGHQNASGGRFYGTLQEATDLYSKNII